MQQYFGRKALTGVAMAATLLVTSISVQAIPNAELTEKFTAYQDTIGEFNVVLSKAMASSDWSEVSEFGNKLKSLSENFVAMSGGNKDSIWNIYAANLDNHTVEMTDAIAAKDGPEAIFLSGVLLQHLAYMQSTNGAWLRVYYPEQLKLLKKALADKDAKAAAEYAEAIHLGANKIAASAGMQKNLYKHTRWLKDVIQLGRVGDSIIGAALEGKFADTGKDVKYIEKTLKKWDKSFR